MRFGPNQLSCLGSSVGRALCLECRVSWVRVPPEAAHFFLGKVTALGVLCCFALFVCLNLLASFFLPCTCMYLQQIMFMLRYPQKPGSKNYQNIFPPSSTLHLSNIPLVVWSQSCVADTVYAWHSFHYVHLF